MHIDDILQFAFHAMRGYRTRTYLMLLAITTHGVKSKLQNIIDVH